MDDSSLPVANQNNIDSFPLFKNFTEPKDTQDAFTIDKNDIQQIQSNIAAKPQTSEQNTVAKISTKKPGLSHAAICDICSVLLSAVKDYDSHIKGKKHQTQLTAVLTKDPQYKTPTYEELRLKHQESVAVNNQNEKPEASLSETNKSSALPLANNLICHVCNVTCNSQRMFDDHVNGKKHRIKLKLNNLTNPAPSRLVPDNNPSSSNYCDVCSVQLSSETKLTEHLSQKRHQLRVKDDEFCTKEAAAMNINLEDYQISTTDPKKNWFTYQCTPCNKKFGNKIKLIEHLKSALHTQLSNQSKTGHRPQNINRGNYHGTQIDTVRNRFTGNSQSFSSPRGLKKPLEKSRPPYQSQGSWNQRSQPFNRNSNQQISNNIFGAFDPDNQSTFSSTNTYQYPTKRSTQSTENTDQYSGFYPKRSRTYNNESDNLQYSYSTYGNNIPSSTFSEYSLDSQNYSSQITNYNNQSSASQYPTDSYYTEQQNSRPISDYMNPLNYPSEQPPLPNYPPPASSQNYYPDYSGFTGDTKNQGTNNYAQPSFHY